MQLVRSQPLSTSARSCTCVPPTALLTRPAALLCPAFTSYSPLTKPCNSPTPNGATKTQRQVRMHVSSPASPTAPAAAPSYQDAPAIPIMAKGELSQLPDAPGVYAVLSQDGKLQYIGLSRKISQSVAAHLQELPELTHSIKVAVLETATRDTLTGTWRAWVEAAVGESGEIPPGNAPGETKWQSRSVARATKPEIKLTAGKPITGLTITDLVEQVVKGNKVVAFIKGTRQQPQCGFSNKMLTILNDTKVDYEVVNVLDDVHNPGLRDAIKAYSQWPTIPQLYIGGEFVGGSDIVEEMVQKDQLLPALKATQ